MWVLSLRYHCWQQTEPALSPHDVACAAQAHALLLEGKESGKHTPPDLEGQAEEGALDKAKNSGEDCGVMSARAGSWTDMTQTDRYA